MGTYSIGQKVKESGSLNEMIRIKAQPDRVELCFGVERDEYILSLAPEAVIMLIVRLRAAVDAANIMERGEAKDLP